MKRNLLVLLACVLMALCIISCDDHTHTYSDEWSSDETYHWHAATCEHSTEVKDKAEHVWNDGEITTPATAGKKGVKTYTCTVCKKTKTEDISICTEHKMVEHKAKAATCTEKGWEAYEVCSVCGYSTYKEIPAKGHDYKCVPTEDKTKHHEKCSVCGDVKADSEKDHVWDDGTETKAATCTEKGVKTFTCNDCKATKTEEIAALGHDMSLWEDVDTDVDIKEAEEMPEKTRKCTRTGCNYSETEGIITGEGTAEKPFEIATPIGLIALAETCNYTGTEEDEEETMNGYKDKVIVLVQDIDLSGVDNWTPIGLYSDENDTDEFEKRPFSGTFNGQNHTISGLKINLDNGKSSYRALFGYVDGTVENLTVEGTVIACDSAGVVGALGDGGKIDNVTNKVSVSNTTSTGGTYPHAKAAGIVVAVKKGTATISNCTNEGTITSTATDTKDDAVGGIVAWSNASNLTITDCVNNGKIESKGGQYAGGIIGAVRKHKDDANATVPVVISNCKNTAVITAESEIVGGIIGQVGTYNTNPLNPTLTECSTENEYKLVGVGNYAGKAAE